MTKTEGGIGLALIAIAFGLAGTSDFEDEQRVAAAQQASAVLMRCHRPVRNDDHRVPAPVGSGLARLVFYQSQAHRDQTVELRCTLIK